MRGRHSNNRADRADRVDEALWQRVKDGVQKSNIGGTKANQWSARKAQIAVRRYKALGGRYKGPRRASNSLVKWSRQRWRTASGRPSHITGERYLPAKAFQALSDREIQVVNESKRRAFKQGRQFDRMPVSISKKVKPFRRVAAG